MINVKKLVFGSALESFEHLGVEYLVSNEPHLVIGHGDKRHLKLAVAMANKFPDSQIVYYDNSSRGRGCGCNCVRGDLPRNVHLTSRPGGKFGTVDLMWTLHSFDDAREILKEIYDSYLLSKGRVGVIDYVLNWIHDLPESQQIPVFKKVFATSLSEKNSLKEEGDNLCLENHTKYSLDSLTNLFSSSGFKPLDAEVEYVDVNGISRPKTMVAFFEKV